MIFAVFDEWLLTQWMSCSFYHLRMTNKVVLMLQKLSIQAGTKNDPLIMSASQKVATMPWPVSLPNSLRTSVRDNFAVRLHSKLPHFKLLLHYSVKYPSTVSNCLFFLTRATLC